MRTIYTPSELQQILKSIVVICDTREKKDKHIIDWLESKQINFEKRKLDFGDYSFMLPANPLMGTIKDKYFDKHIVIERKAHLEELSGNLAQNRDRFENEFLRSRHCEKYLLIEKGCLSDIWDNSYNTQFKPSSYMGSLMAFEQRYGIRTVFVNQKHSGQWIYGKFYYYLKELLENGL
jgi:ERCC4-type nuclease